MAVQGETTEPDRLLELYKIAVDEYRFQVDLNWRRSQYLFVLNAAVLVAGVGILASATASRFLVGPLPFLAGIVLAVMSVLVTRTRHEYYRAARDTMVDLRKQVAGTSGAVATTPGQGSGRRRRVRVTTLQYAILATLGLADGVGAVLAFVS